MLEKFRRITLAVSGWAEWLALVAVVFIVALTCVDVIGAKLFRAPIPASVDMASLAQVIAISFASSMALVRKQHVAVEFFVDRFSPRTQARIICVAEFLSLVLFAILFWRLLAHGYHQFEGNEETATGHIPLAPFTYAVAAGIAPLCLMLAYQFVDSLLKVLRNEP